MPHKSTIQKPRMVCRCKAYKFPHRPEGGKCNAVTQDAYWPERRRVRNWDEVLDDPRRGQAAWINAQNRG